MKLEILCGMIASGKSTYCREKIKTGAVVVNDDAITTAVHGGDYTLYDDKLKILYKAVEMAIITHAFALGRDVVIDRPCLMASTRRRYTEIARGFDVPAEIVVFEKCSPEIHAKRRAASDCRGHDYDYWLKVAKIHDGMYQEPKNDEANKVWLVR
jgi:predicted kinase